MKLRKVLIWSVSIVVGLPVGLVLAAGLAFYIGGSCYAPNQVNGAIVSSGQKREFLLYVPGSYDRAKAAPLMISLHGAGLWPSSQMAATQWDRVADAEGMIVVYPAGTTVGGQGTGLLPFRAWLMEPAPVMATDTRFIGDLIDTLEARYHIDPARVYVTGLSNGGGMAFGLSCTLHDRIAAIGTSAAAQILPFSWCPDPRPIPMITFHGTADPLVPYGGAPPGMINPRPFPAVTDWVADWARRNRCDPAPVDSQVATDVVRHGYRGCADDADVVFYTIEGGGHTWPGGKPMPAWAVGRMTRSIDATALMWEFFRAHPLKSRR